jgi:hypothetical protein
MQIAKCKLEDRRAPPAVLRSGRLSQFAICILQFAFFNLLRLFR